MTAYTLTAPELNLEALEVGLEKIAAATRHVPLAAKTVAMFVVGPILGLAFVIALPLIGFAIIAYYCARLLVARRVRIARYLKHVALFIAAPFIGLAYLLVFPFVGLGMLAYCGVKAARN